MNDYADAAGWHFESASVLHEQSRHQQSCRAGASHGYGIAAECVLKALMCDLKPQSNKVSGRHLGYALWREFENHQVLQAHTFRAHSALQSQSQFANANWDINHRYLNHTAPHFSAQRLEQQEQGARKLVGLLQLVQRGLA